MTLIAIDGPAGAGKSTVARLVAAALGLPYADTGAMYRAIALAALERQIAPDDAEGLSVLARDASVRLEGDRVLLDGRDVTDRIREPDVTAVVPAVSAAPGVRDALLAVQRAMVEGGSVVMEGRDIGTVVMPEAQVKVFLTADLDERARRRAAETPVGSSHPNSHVSDLEARDRADSTRAVSPLLQAEDAEVIDTTGLSIEEVVARVVELARERGAG